MRKCDKTSTEPADHAGPLELVSVMQYYAGEVRIASCKACGSSVLRRVRRSRSGAPGRLTPPQVERLAKKWPPIK